MLLQKLPLYAKARIYSCKNRIPCHLTTRNQERLQSALFHSSVLLISSKTRPTPVPACGTTDVRLARLPRGAKYLFMILANVDVPLYIFKKSQDLSSRVFVWLRDARGGGLLSFWISRMGSSRASSLFKRRLAWLLVSRTSLAMARMSRMAPIIAVHTLVMLYAYDSAVAKSTCCAGTKARIWFVRCISVPTKHQNCRI